MAAKTEKAVSEDAQKPKPKVNTNAVDLFYALLRWLQVNIVPIIALPALGVLAADDIKNHLLSNPHNQFGIEFSLIVGIAVAALLVVSVGSHKR